MQITIDQANAEITANQSAIAQTIRAQSEAGDTAAKQLVDAFTVAISEPDPAKRETATTQFLSEYETWRGRFPDLVGPTAAALGHPAPGIAAPPSPANGIGSIFAPTTLANGTLEPATPPQAAPAPIPEAGVPAERPRDVTQTAPAPAAPPEAAVSAVSSPAGGVSKSRKAWSQAAIAGLTRAVLMAPNGDVAAALDTWAGQNPGFNAGDAAAKATELELIAAPPASKVYELTQADKDELEVRVSQHLVDPSAAPPVRLVQLKYCAQVLREEIKALAG